MVFAALIASTACTRTARVPPTEIPKLSGGPTSVVPVELTDGGRVLIRPNFRRVRVVYRGQRSRIDDVYRPPLSAEIRGESLVIKDSKRERPVAYPLSRIERTEVSQPDAGTTETVLFLVLAGAVVGAIIGAAAGDDCPEKSERIGDTLFCGKAYSAAAGAPAGAALGAIVSIPITIGNQYYTKGEE